MKLGKYMILKSHSNSNMECWSEFYSWSRSFAHGKRFGMFGNLSESQYESEFWSEFFSWSLSWSAMHFRSVLWSEMIFLSAVWGKGI